MRGGVSEEEVVDAITELVRGLVGVQFVNEGGFNDGDVGDNWGSELDVLVLLGWVVCVTAFEWRRIIGGLGVGVSSGGIL
jgi:hypothetical protein